VLNKKVVSAGSKADRTSDRQPCKVELKKCHTFTTDGGTELIRGSLQEIR
jgi:hypothetical protein